MSLHELAATVFRDGCGISLQYALRTPRFTQLRADLTVRGVPHAEDSALVAVLGERLADRAFRNLPPVVRTNTEWWREGTPSQVDLIGTVVNEMDGANWRRGREDPDSLYPYNSDIRCVLPHTMKSWYAGKVKPNCLGEAQMLVGLARNMGAAHVLASVVYSYEQRTTSHKLTVVRTCLNILKDHPTPSDEVANLRSKYERSEHFLLLRYGACLRTQAHHILVVRLDDGNWHAVDPYMMTDFSLGNPDEIKLLTDPNTPPNKTFLLDTETEVPEYIKKSARLTDALKMMCSLITNSDERTTQLIDRLLFLSAFSRHPEALKGRNFEDAMHEEWKLPEYVDALTLVYDTLARATYTNYDDAFRLLVRSQDDTQLRTQIAWQIVAYHLLAILWFLDGLEQQNMHARRHPTLEVGQPGLMLGAATLNHARLYQPVRLKGHLSALCDSQWVFADTLAHERKGDAIDPDLQSTFAARLAALGHERAARLVPPLRYLTNEVREHHG